MELKLQSNDIYNLRNHIGNMDRQRVVVHLQTKYKILDFPFLHLSTTQSGHFENRK